MLAIKLHIKEVSDYPFLRKKREDFSCAMRYAYVRIHLHKKAELLPMIKERFEMNDIEARSVYTEAKAKFEQTKKGKENIEGRLVEIGKELKKLSKKGHKSEKDVRREFKLNQKKVALGQSLGKDITFGGKHRLRRISYLSNFRGKRMAMNDGRQIDVDKDLGELREEYVQQRLLSIYLLGEANQKGNRFFSFDFKNKKITYKPKKGTKIEIKFNCPQGQMELLQRLQELAEKKEMALTVRIGQDEVNIYYDDALLSGYYIDEQARKVEWQEAVKDIIDPEEKAAIIKGVYKKYYEMFDVQRLNGKIPYRIFSWDNNPNHLGCVIQDFKGAVPRTVYAWHYDLTEINKKPPKGATKKERKRINQKREHGLKHIWDDIFATLMYFKCGYFGSENLDLKQKDGEDSSREANRQTKNIWLRELSSQLIDKYITKYGIIHRKINAAYTSTIGNLLHNFIDPINAAIEIGRRAFFQFHEDSFYPEICAGTIDHAMSRLLALNPQLRDVGSLKDCTNWVEIHRSIRGITGLRYRVSSYDDMCLIHTNPSKRSESTKLKHSKIKKYIFAN